MLLFLEAGDPVMSSHLHCFVIMVQGIHVCSLGSSVKTCTLVWSSGENEREGSAGHVSCKILENISKFCFSFLTISPSSSVCVFRKLGSNTI